MTTYISFALVTLTVALSGCADWGKIGYLEPGGLPHGASKVNGESCSLSGYTPVASEAIEKAFASQSVTVGLKNVEVTLDNSPGHGLCANVVGEPIK